MEREYLGHQQSELLEKMSGLQKKNEVLMVENEKLKSENKQKRFLNKSQVLTSKNRSFIFGKMNFKDTDDSKSTITNNEKENSNKKNFKYNKFQ